AIRLRPRRVAALLGVGVPRAQIGRRLSALGASCRPDRDALLVTPPSHRGDLQREEDLVEEVARLGGYDAIPVSLAEAPFTIGKGYGLDAQGRRQERRALAILLCGTWPPRGAERSGPPVEFGDLKGIVENVLADLGVEEPRVRWRPLGEEALLHPGKGAIIEVAGTAIGVAGALHPKIAQTCDLAEEVWLSELDFEILADYGSRRVELRSLPRFPAVTRDIAVIVDEAFPAAAILEEVRSLA